MGASLAALFDSSELLRAHARLLGLLAALPWSDLGCTKVVHSGSSERDSFDPSGL